MYRYDTTFAGGAGRRFVCLHVARDSDAVLVRHHTHHVMSPSIFFVKALFQDFSPPLPMPPHPPRPAQVLRRSPHLGLPPGPWRR
jgi:hypothetical protein